MPTQRAELIRRRFEEMERGSVDALIADAAEDFEFVNPDYALEPGTRHGPEGARIALGNLLDAFDGLCWDLQKVEEHGDRVLVTGTWAGRGKTSGAEFDGQPFGVVVTFRGDEVVRLEWFNRAEQALQAFT